MTRLRVVSTLVGCLLALPFVSVEARADAAETLIEQCHVQLDMTAGGCDCIGNSARRDLTETQQEYVVAQVTEDQDAIQSLQGGMTVDEITVAAEWMMSIPATCEQQ